MTSIFLPVEPTVRAQDGAEQASARPDSGRAGELLQQRRDVQDSAVESLGQNLRATADRLASALREYVEGKAGGTDSARVRAAIYSTRLDDLLVLLQQQGLADARDAWFDEYSRLADLAEQQLVVAGVSEADRALDGEGAQAALDAYRQADDDALWDAQIERPAASRILTGLRTGIELQSLDEVAQVIARDEAITLPQATTAAVTRIAEYDRWVAGEAARQVDPSGDKLLWAYAGPQDGTQRPFCRVLNGHFLTGEQVGKLDNHQPGTGHPSISGGGHRCRHQWLRGPASYLEKLGYKRGDDQLVSQANAAATTKGAK